VIQKKDNLLPALLAVFLHFVLFASLVVVLDFKRTPDLALPLAINATLVTENAVVIPPKVQEPPKVEETPKVEEPLPEPDTREEERLAAEQQKREADAVMERERLKKIERAKAEAEAEKRRKQAEAEEQRRRDEAEKKRLADIERQRLENERLRKEAEAAARQQELDKEAQRVAAITASAKQAYIFAIQQKISRNWVRPANAAVGLECTIKVQQLPGGEVIDVKFGACNGDATIQRSIESAVYKASPLPAPRDPSVFDRNLTLLFKPEE
jgi:colicin import membrane protein